MNIVFFIKKHFLRKKRLTSSKIMYQFKADSLQQQNLHGSKTNKVLVCLPQNKTNKKSKKHTVLGSFIVKDNTVVEMLDKDKGLANFDNVNFN